jgi:hypothetical protein
MPEYKPKGRWYFEVSLLRFAFPLAVWLRNTKDNSDFTVTFLFLSFGRIKYFRVPKDIESGN